ncbi:RagB/SusD family nutrient uptake outer membrane protein [Flavobacterium sp. '19STA2R22 D10 B1']|uniref:RagB/SusD family nutrient uptake outer membrane protein n=1 Tax=Flavobacterium aerium TaxID=3037261 RepID=UPI00278C8564|nr:RagB/SusD family nutrient uptake outer membrane protein [Flavobacterium sp. '19STA2R22 D10 B1']
MKKILYSIFAMSLLLGTMTSCNNDDLDPTLADKKDIENVKTVSDLTGLLNGAYNRMTNVSYYGRDFIIYGEVRADNTFANGNSNRFVQEGAMDVLSTYTNQTNTWDIMYKVIANCNIIIAADVTGDEGEINYVKGQALALRALVHFDLLKLYGQQHVNGGGLNALGVPYISKYKDMNNLYPTRNTVNEVKNFAFADLNLAIQKIQAGTASGNSKETVGINAVRAIQARMALYFGDWQLAKTASQEILDTNQYTITASDKYKDSFDSKQSGNSIFELAFRGNDNLGNNSLTQIYQATNYGDVQVLQNLVDLYSATDVRSNGDLFPGEPSQMIRKVSNRWRNYGKYPTLESNVKIFRVEEIYLINAEARFELDNADPIALTNLNAIPARRGAAAYASATKANILLERRKEFAFEGFRFDDLARTGQSIPNVDPQQTHGGPAYGSTKYAFPIPLTEITANSNLVQNAGYN